MLIYFPSSRGFTTVSALAAEGTASFVAVVLAPAGNAGKKQSTTIPAVPIRTPMFDGDGNLTRTWMIFFESLGRAPAQRTLLVKDSTSGNNIADHLKVYQGGPPVIFTGVLRKAITADLAVRVNLNGASFITLTVPKATPVDTVISTTAFPAKPPALTTGDILSWDITSSDGSKDVNGVASFTLVWKTVKAPGA